MVRRERPFKRAVARAFGRAAPRYHAAAQLQRHVACCLARRVTAHLQASGSPRAAGTCLEVGCGTGHLTAQLVEPVGGRWIVGDLAPQMVEQCRRQVGDRVDYLCFDGELPPFTSRCFDLVASSLAVQWFVDLPSSIARLSASLRRGGTLALATLVDGTFSQWFDQLAACGVAPRTPRYPTIAQLASMAPSSCAITIDDERLDRRYASGHAFLAELRRLGADTPSFDSVALSPAVLLGALRGLEGDLAAGATVSYHVAYALFTRE